MWEIGITAVLVLTAFNHLHLARRVEKLEKQIKTLTASEKRHSFDLERLKMHTRLPEHGV
jgi:chaperonin cofactor prefoldin